MRNLAEGVGIGWPTYQDWIVCAAAASIVALIWAVAHVLGRLFGHRLADFWTQRAGGRGEEIVPRLCALTRYSAAAFLLAIVLRVDSWRPLGALAIGLALAAASALLVRQLVRGLGMPRWVAALLAGLVGMSLFAHAVGGLEPVTTALDEIGFTAAGHRISLLGVIEFAVTVVALYAIVKLLNRLVGQSIARASNLDPTQRLLVQKLAGLAIVVTAFFVGIDILGIDLTALAVFSGAFGLAIGFGLQKTFGNLIAGIILLMDRSVKPGDVIVVGDSFGTISKIGVRAVSIITRDGKEHLIPNENLMTQEVENWSYSSRNVRIHIKVGVAYDCDLALAQKLMVQAATESQRVLEMPSPSVWLRAFGQSSVDHEILAWVGDPEAGIGSVQSDVLNRLWVLFREHRIALPYPQQDVHIKEWPGPPPPLGD